MTDSLSGLKILLTGASRGVGLASAKVFLEKGAEVIGVARDAARLAQAEQELEEFGPGRFTRFVLDLSDAEAPARLASFVEKSWGLVHVAIFNAGIQLHHTGGIMVEPMEAIENSMNINFWSPLLCARALLPLLERAEHPRLINVGSGAGSLGLMQDGGIASYRLSKWTLHGLTMLQAQELRGRVSVNAFDPGWVKTDLGGPQAPGTVEEAAQGLLACVELPWDTTGKFHKDGAEIPW